MTEPVIPDPPWKAQKDLFDSYDDGNGPYMHQAFSARHSRALVKEFIMWAADNLGQGYSLACSEGSFVDQVTSWCFTGYCAGRFASLGIKE